MSLPRILVIDNSTHITGALKSIVRTSYDLREYFDFIFVLPLNTKARRYVEESGFRLIYELPLIELSRSPVSIFKYLPGLILNAIRLKQIIRKEAIQLLHANDLYNLLPIALKVVNGFIPYVCHVRFMPDKFPALLFSFWVNVNLRYAKRLICVSNSQKEKLRSHSRIVMIPNELPLNEKYSNNLVRDKTVLYLSNIIRGKGQELAIEAFSRLAEKDNWMLRFVGGDMGLEKNKDFKRELVSIAQQKNLHSKIEWIDFVEDVESEFKKASIALNFSDSESFSLTCVEAQYFQCPIIATRSGGPAEIIIDGETGFLVDKDDINSMVSCIQKLIDNEVLRSSFAKKGREVVMDRFSVQNTSLKLKQIYNEGLVE
jgi:L-malate glycosyltransferase